MPSSRGHEIDSPRAVAQELIAAAVTRGERVVSAARILFCTVMLVRFVWLGELTNSAGAPLKAWIATGAVILAIIFSVWEIHRSLRGNLSQGILLWSVVLDAVVCFCTLLPNALWPWPEYQGLLVTPDALALLVITLATGLRLSMRVAIVGSACNVLSFSVLMLADYVVSGDQLLKPAANIGMGAIVMLAIAGLAVILSNRTRRLVEKAAAESARSARARRSLEAVLEDQHDMRAMLSPAILDAGLLARLVGAANKKNENPAGLDDTVARLNRSLANIHTFVEEARERAYGAKVTLDSPELVDTLETVDAILPTVQRRFPDVVFEVPRGDDLAAWVMGGAGSLRRVLLNVLVNACEGDGHRGAARVAVSFARPTAQSIAIAVTDDGPGFPADLIEEPLSRCFTSKDKGSGLGLYMVAGIVRASGGEITRSNLESGGARVVLELPAQGDERLGSG